MSDAADYVSAMTEMNNSLLKHMDDVMPQAKNLLLEVGEQDIVDQINDSLGEMAQAFADLLDAFTNAKSPIDMSEVTTP